MSTLKAIYKMLLCISFFTPFLLASGSHKHEATSGAQTQASTVKGTQKVCPIRKKPIDPDVSMEYQGQKIYFCCAGCDEKFKADSETYFKEMKSRGEVADSIQKFCPVTGDQLEDHDVSVALPGRKVYFCCKKCAKKFKKDKEKYLKSLGMVPKASSKAHDHSSHGHGSHKH